MLDLFMLVSVDPAAPTIPATLPGEGIISNLECYAN